MKLIKKLKEKDLDVLLLIIIMAIVPIFFIQLYSGDELWNFAFVYKMSLGFIPYKELNIIVPPLFHIIGLCFFKIFGANFFGFRIYNLVIITTILFLTFKIFKTLKLSKKNNLINIILIYIPFSTVISAGVNYNRLAYIPILIILLLLLKDKKNYLIHGFLILITLLIKQNIGIFLGIGIVLYILINRKNIIKNLFEIFIINIIGVLIFLLVLYKNGILYDFYFYVISGLKAFSLNNIHIDDTILWIFFVIIINIIFIYFIGKSNIKNKSEIIENIKIIYSIGIPLLLVAYPIFNMCHIYLAIFVLFIGLIYIIYVTFAEELITDRLTQKIIVVLLFFVFIKNIYIAVIQIKEFDIIKDNNNVYYGIFIDRELKENIRNVSEFIKESEKKGYNTIVLSQHANLYMLPLNKNNKDGMDLPFKGNLGHSDEKGLIEKISLLRNTFILIVSNEEDMLWQESKQVREYIQNNLDKVGVLEGFDIYYKN